MKVLLSLEEQLVRRIDRAARASGLTRSAYITQLAQRELGQAKGPGATPSARAAMRRLDRLFAALPHEEATVAIRAERDAR